ncbi:MAG: nickel-dependent hydrogenase large subunit [Planctomycetes bacterium]|nr:nickel-dependent hydrogenase large subunit [Planctomycetota bacterium]
MPAAEVKASRRIEVPLNRVEGDLEIRVELQDGCVADAWSSGTLYRGIENMLVGRGSYDGLVITPRVCGICGTAHLTAAAMALDQITGASPPANGILARHLALLTEHLQSDVRHAELMFFADFVNPAYANCALHSEAVRRFAPFQGRAVVEAIKETRKVIEIIAILGGQWPHSSYMVPGGVSTVPKKNEILRCRHLLGQFRAWYEHRILGCSCARWAAIQSCADLDAWLDESLAHRAGDLGFFMRFAREASLDRIGRGHGNFLCFGQCAIPAGSAVRGPGGKSDCLVPGGFARGETVLPFDQEKVAEHVAHSWYEDYAGGRHPFDGVTRPFASGAEGRKYSWAKAPRYDGQPAETGPLAEMIVSGHPLFRDLVARGGPNVFVRELARLVRPVALFPAMEQWFAEIGPDEKFYTAPPRVEDGRGFGGTEASRGALGHWVKIAGGRIERYQIITPTAWNGSPRDSEGVRGPWEEALVGTPVKDPENPVELGHVIRSFDACLVCTVHTLEGRRALARTRI